MKILVATDAHIYRTPDGKHWTPAIYGYSFWKRFLNVFDVVRIVARTKNIDAIEGKYLQVDGPGIEIFPLPFYQGPRQLLKVYFKIKRKLKNVDKGCDVALFRMPSQTAYMVYKAIKGKMPIGGEIVYDPYDDLKNKENPLFIRILDNATSRQLRKFCLSANGVSYVTEKTIQEHYPSIARMEGENSRYFETFYSTITLQEDAFCEPKSSLKKDSLCVSLSDVSMNSDRKGEPILLKAISKVRNKGYLVDAVIIGDGLKRVEFENLAQELGISSHVTFTGRLASSDEVREVLKKSDMFVFPTQAEGLPRGILEAMAIGLPVLSTPVGGIPEVLEEEFLFNPMDVDTLASKICWLYDNQEEMNKIAKLNYERAQNFKNSVLQKKRDDFYGKLLAIAEEGSF